MLTREKLLHLFHYNKDKGLLIWKNPPLNHDYLIGKLAGTIEKIDHLSYLRIGIDKKRYLAHTLIYFIETNSRPKFLDHIDGNGLNNQFTNLRPTFHRSNQQNRSRHRLGGLPGASFEKSRGKWQSYVQIDKKRIHLGRYNSEIEAHQRYISELKVRGLM